MATCELDGRHGGNIGRLVMLMVRLLIQVAQGIGDELYVNYDRDPSCVEGESACPGVTCCSGGAVTPSYDRPPGKLLATLPFHRASRSD